MADHYELKRYTDYKEWLDWPSERQRLSNNVEALKRTSEAMASTTQELSVLFEEVQFNLAASRSLRAQLNKMAIQMGLALIGGKRL